MNHFAVHQKLTQLYKSTILKKIKKTNKPQNLIVNQAMGKRLGIEARINQRNLYSHEAYILKDGGI